MLAVEVGKASHVGRIRRANEDALFVGSRLFVVADGMGGHAAGAIASRTALEVLAGLDRAPVTCDALRSQVVEANRAVVAYGRTHPEGLGLGTTLAGIALIAEDEEEHWAVFHVGDSRVYEVRDSVVRQLTVDHSEVQELISAGMHRDISSRGPSASGRHRHSTCWWSPPWSVSGGSSLAMG